MSKPVIAEDERGAPIVAFVAPDIEELTRNYMKGKDTMATKEERESAIKRATEIVQSLNLRGDAPPQRGNINKRVPVGVGMIVRCGDYVLLGKRGPDCSHGVGQWSLPGGKPDGGEHPQDAAIRELAEETGIVLEGEYVDQVPWWDYDRFDGDDLHYVTVYFKTSIDPNKAATVRTVEPGKCEGWKWCRVGTIREPKQFISLPGPFDPFDDTKFFAGVDSLASRGLL